MGSVEWREARDLLRARLQLVRPQVRVKNTRTGLLAPSPGSAPDARPPLVKGQGRVLAEPFALRAEQAKRLAAELNPVLVPTPARTQARRSEPPCCWRCAGRTRRGARQAGAGPRAAPPAPGRVARRAHGGRPARPSRLGGPAAPAPRGGAPGRRFRDRLLYLANASKQHHGGLEEWDAGVGSLYLGPVLLGRIDERTMRVHG